MAEAKAKRLADIINVIGANLGVTVPKTTVQIPYVRPEIKTPTEIEKPERTISKELRSKNIYEIADMLKIPLPKFTPEVQKTIGKFKSWKELGSIAQKLKGKYPYVYKKAYTEVLGAIEPLEKTISKIKKLAKKYPVSREQAKSIYEILSHSPYKKSYQEILREHWGKVIAPSEELKERVQKVLTEPAEEALERARKKYKTIEEEKLRLPEYVWHKGYRGKTLAERTREEVREFNENIKNIAKYTESLASSLSSEDTAKYIATWLNADLAWDVAREIYNMTGGRIDLSSLHRQLIDVSTKSKKYLTEMSNTLKKLFDLKADFMNELKNLVKEVS